MMNYHKQVILLILTIFTSVLHSQNESEGRIVYGKQIIADFSKSNALKDLNNLNSDTGLEYELVFANGVAIFHINKNMDLDGDLNSSFSKNMGGGKGLYYFNAETGEKLRETVAFGEPFLLTNFLEGIEWKISRDTMMIGNLLCYKATSFKKIVRPNKTFVKPITAWFSTNIPIGYGPIGYNGLPGLILDLIIEDEVRFYPKEIVFEKVGEIKKPTKGRKMTHNEFESNSMAMYKKAIERHSRKNN